MERLTGRAELYALVVGHPSSSDRHHLPQGFLLNVNTFNGCAEFTVRTHTHRYKWKSFVEYVAWPGMCWGVRATSGNIVCSTATLSCVFEHFQHSYDCERQLTGEREIAKCYYALSLRHIFSSGFEIQPPQILYILCKMKLRTHEGAEVWMCVRVCVCSHSRLSICQKCFKCFRSNECECAMYG